MLQMLKRPSLIMSLSAITEVLTGQHNFPLTISTMQRVILTHLVFIQNHKHFCFNRIEKYRKHLPSVLYLFGKQTQEELWQACLLKGDVG